MKDTLKSHKGGSKPYSRPKSLLGAMKNMLSPSWLVDLVQTIKKNNGPNSDESPKGFTKESSTQCQPSQMGHDVVQTSPLLGLSNNKVLFEATQPYTSKLPGSNGFEDDQRRPNLAHSMETKDSFFDSVHVSGNRETKLASPDKSDRNSYIFWSAEKTKPQNPAPSNAPRFKPEVLTSPQRSSIFGNEYFSSYYYPGKTSYGGASATRKPPVAHNVTPHRSVVTNKSSGPGDAGLSRTAQRIRDSLEKMSTPLSDAKRIPLNSSYSNSPLSFSVPTLPSTYRRQGGLPESVPRGPPVSRVPALDRISVLRNAQPTRTPQGESPREASKTQTPVVDSIEGDKMPSGKMRRERQRHHAVAKTADEVEPVVNTLPLPPAVPLQLSNPVTLNLDLPNPPKPEVQPIVASMSDTSAPVMTSYVESGFKFSEPRSVESSVSSSRVIDSPASLKFSSPISIEQKEGKIPEKKSKVEAEKPSLAMNFDLSTATKLKKVQKEEPPKIACGLPVATELKKGSVMDFLGGKSAAKPIDVAMKQQEAAKPASAWGSIAKKPTGSWDCEMCMIRNKADVDKCAACMTPRVQKASDTQKPAATANETFPSSTDSIAALFQKPKGNWDCDTCMIQNKMEAQKCVACESPKPGASPAKKPPPVTSSWGAAFKPAGDKWECSTCMVRNPASKNRCAACETPKPGCDPTPPCNQATSSVSLAPTGGFKFGAPISTSASSTTFSSGFTFGVASTASSAASDPPRFGSAMTSSAPATTGFVFGASTTAVSSTVTSLEPIKFGFTAPKSTDTTDAPIQFGVKVSSAATSASVAATPLVATPQVATPTESADLATSAPTSTPMLSIKNLASVATSPFQFGVPIATNSTAPGSGFSFGVKAEENAGGAGAGLGTRKVDSPKLAFAAGNVALSAVTSSLIAPTSLFGTAAASTASTGGSLLFGSAATKNNASPFTASSFSATATTTSSLSASATPFVPTSAAVAKKEVEAQPFVFGAQTTAPDSVTPVANHVSIPTFSTTPASSQPSAVVGANFTFNPGKRKNDDDGPSAKKATPSNLTSAFSFGNQPTTTSSQAPFSFGAPDVTSSVKNPPPAFGSSTPGGANAGFGSNNEPSAPAFGGFGSSSTSNSSAEATFGNAPTSGFDFAASNTQQPQRAGFNFSASSAGATSQAAAPSAGVFQFGGSASTGGANSTTGFGSQNPADNTQAVAGNAVFCFGQTATTASMQPSPMLPPASTFNFNATPTSFNAQAPASGTNAPTFNFNAGSNNAGNSSTPGGNVFSAGNSSTPGTRRPMKKAIRKLRK